MNIKSLLGKIDIYMLILAILTVAGCFFYIQHTSWPLNDLGRELYFPQLVLEGKVLYKDIFNLFGPFSYLFNAVLYKIFGISYATMYCFGYFVALTMILSVYIVGKTILGKGMAFLVSMLAISVGVTTTQNFNYCFPYAYSILYGMIMFIWSAFFYIKYIRTKKPGMMLWAMFFAGISIANKYEFILYAAFLAILLIREFFVKKQIELKIFISSLVLLALPSAVCFAFLFWQGLTIGDMVIAIGMIKSIVLTDSYKYFYQTVGTLFSKELSAVNALYFFLFLLSMGVLSLSEKLYEEKSKLAYVSALFAIYFIYYVFLNMGSNSSFAFISHLVLILIIIERKHLTEETFFWSVAALLASYKVFAFCFIKYYGVFFIPVLLLAFLVLINRYSKFKKYITYYLMILILFTMYSSVTLRNYTVAGLHMSSPKIKTFYDTAYKINKLIKYIKENTSENDRVVIYPEGGTINFITNRKTENIYYALSPAYLELFGEDKLIKYFEVNKPEYFVLTNSDMHEYGKMQMCKDYANMFCKFLKKNYVKVKTYGYVNDPELYEIYKKI